jgi:hypothetical protein
MAPSIERFHMNNRIPPTITLPARWQACDAGMEHELKREIALNFFHPLKNVQAISVARANYADDVLFELPGHKHKLAQVHLTWSKEFHPHWPDVAFFDSWEQWIASVDTEDEELE